MDINQITSQMSEAFGRQGESGSTELGQQEFLQLLVAQMRHQDPINPLDGAEFASQLAQFNSVEQLINVNSGLESLEQSQEMMSESMTNAVATSLAGKEVRAMSDQVRLQSGEDSHVNFRLANAADEVELVIRNAGGSEVRREVLSGMAAGDHDWNWDGRNSVGDPVGEGLYHVQVNASAGGDSVETMTFSEGVVNHARFTSDGVRISVNGVEIPLSDVEQVGAAR